MRRMFLRRVIQMIHHHQSIIIIIPLTSRRGSTDYPPLCQSYLSFIILFPPSMHQPLPTMRVVQWELLQWSCWYWSCCRCTCMCISMGSDSDEENTDNNVPINPIHNNLKQERAKLQCHYPRLQKDLLKD